MKLNLSKEIIGRGGKTTTIGDKPMTAKDAVEISLDHVDPQQRLSWEKEILRGKLCKRLEAGECEFKVEEVAEMKEAVRTYPWFPVAKVNILDALDPEVELKDVSKEA